MHVAGANTVLPIVDAAKYIKHTLCGFEARIINRGAIRISLNRRHNELNRALHFSLMSSVDSQRCGLRVIAAGMSKGNDPTSTAISECSESANEDILLFFFQLDLTTRIQCALNTDQYEIAQQLRSKLAEVEQEVARQRESKMGSTSSKDEAQDKAIAILRLRVCSGLDCGGFSEIFTSRSGYKKGDHRTDQQKAIEDEDYVYAAELRNKISKLEAESLAAAAKALAYQNVEYAFRLGQKVRHAVFGYRAVICGMDPLCCESSSWIENANVDKLSRGCNQPFYQVLVDVHADPSPLVAYVAEENLLKLDEPDLDRFDHPYIFLLFYGMDAAGDFIPIKQLREKYNRLRHEVPGEYDGNDVDSNKGT